MKQLATAAQKVATALNRARRGQTTHPQDVPVDGPCGVRGLTTAPRLLPTA
jgi:hypothetical protein